MTTLLHARELAAQRGTRSLFAGLDLPVHAGEVVWLRGRNGQGKTTLLRLLAGLSSPAHGHIERSCGLLYLAHHNALKDDLSVIESLRFLASLHGQACTEEHLQHALARLGMASRAHSLVRTLSQGQRRRAALARLALPDTPALWLLDEPIDALDDAGVVVLLELISQHAQGGGAVVLTSHQALALQQPTPRVVQLDDYAVRRT